MSFTATGTVTAIFKYLISICLLLRCPLPPLISYNTCSVSFVEVSCDCTLLCSLIATKVSSNGSLNVICSKFYLTFSALMLLLLCTTLGVPWACLPWRASSHSGCHSSTHTPRSGCFLPRLLAHIHKGWGLPAWSSTTNTILV